MRAISRRRGGEEAARGGEALPRHEGEYLPHPVLVERITAKVKNLRAALEDHAIRLQGVEVVGVLVRSDTIYP